MSDKSKKQEKIVNLNEDSKKHEHNQAEFEKLQRSQKGKMKK